MRLGPRPGAASAGLSAAEASPAGGRALVPVLTEVLLVLAGLWLLIAPAVLPGRDAGIDAASWNDRVTGPAITVLAVLRLVSPGRAMGMGLALLTAGCWLLAAPWVLGYDNASAFVVNDTVVGVAVVALIAVGLVTRAETAPSEVDGTSSVRRSG